MKNYFIIIGCGLLAIVSLVLQEQVTAHTNIAPNSAIYADGTSPTSPTPHTSKTPPPHFVA